MKRRGREQILDKRGFQALLILATITMATTVTLNSVVLSTHQANTHPARNLTASPPQTAWAKTYGGTDWDKAYSAQQSSDGGYIIAGTTYSETWVPPPHGGGGGEPGHWQFSLNIWLMKTDPAGNQQWSKTYGSTDDEWAHSVQQTVDGGYIVAGWESPSGLQFDGGYIMAGSVAHALLVKADASGNMNYLGTYGEIGDSRAYSVKQTSDGGYIIAGCTSSSGTGGYDFWLVKTDASGNMEWSKTYEDLWDEYACSVQQTADGGYILAGYTCYFLTGLSDMWLVKTNSNGDMEWNKTHGGTGDDGAYSVQQTTDGGYIVAGYTTSFGAGGYDFWLVKTNSTGDMQWDRTYGGKGEDRAYSGQQTSDGGYIAAGSTGSFGAGEEDIWLVKTNSSGDMEWNKTHGGTGDDGAYSVQQTTDGGYIAAGYTNSSGAGDYDFLLVKTFDGRVGQEFTLIIMVSGVAVAAIALVFVDVTLMKKKRRG
jgi:uncharacterized delta-60 repeat protein